MQQFYSKNVSVGKAKPWHIHIWRISEPKFSTGLPSSHVPEALDGVQMGNRADSAHKHPGLAQWSPDDRGHPATHKSPTTPLLKQKTQGPCVQEHEPKPGIIICSQKHPHETLGDKERNPATLRTGADSSGSATADPNQRGDRIKEELPWRIGSSQTKGKAWSQEVKSLDVRLSQREPKESSHDLLKGGVET